jgi:nudix-type nucleoside diphosphatase (YffH/AdpP family)
LKLPEIVKLETRHKGWSRLLVASLRLKGGEIITREIEDHGSAVCVLPYDPARRVAIMIRQFRTPPLYAGQEPVLFEAIAGLLEGDDPAACARREAMEETGLKLGAVEPVATAWSMPGISTERMALFLAPYGAADRIGPGGGLKSEHEDIEVVEIALRELARMADDGTLVDMKALVLVQTLRLRRPELFV